MKLCIVTVLAVLTPALAGCASTYEAADYRDVTIEELLAKPAAWRGEKIRVRGYLVSIDGHVQLLDGRAIPCYGADPHRRYLTTTLPRSVLGEVNQHPDPTGPKFDHDGRAAIVAGVFEGSDRPWGRSSVFFGENPLTAAGPLVRARLVSMGEQRCTFGG